MSNYSIYKADPADRRTQNEIALLLKAAGIRKDKNLDYTCVMVDHNQNIIATGSCFSNTLRCLAVSSAHQGEGLMNEIVSHLVQIQFERGYTHLFLYSKYGSAYFFRSLGFYEIARVDQQIVFMENKRDGFMRYLQNLKMAGNQLTRPDREQKNKRIASVVMNANPFTLGHQYLIEKASLENDIVHLFMISEDVSLIPFSVRKRLIMEGTSHLSNIVYHESGPFIISNATFPSYFQKDEQSVIESHANLDLTIFAEISKALQITSRYVGEEPVSMVTGEYNRIMARKLPQYGIDCRIIPRKEAEDQIISASTVRQLIKERNTEAIRPLVPACTYQFFSAPEAEPIIKRIQESPDVKHY